MRVSMRPHLKVAPSSLYASLMHRAFNRTRASDDRRPGMRLGAYPGPLQIETPFAIPDTTQAPFGAGSRCNRFRFCALCSRVS